MHSKAGKTPESKGKSVANSIAEMGGGEVQFQVNDQRPEAIAQRKMIETANNSPRTKKVAQLLSLTAAQAETNQKPIQQKKNSTGMPDQLKAGIENLSGHSMDDVKVHYNSAKPAQLQAHAFAQGNEIH